MKHIDHESKIASAARLSLTIFAFVTGPAGIARAELPSTKAPPSGPGTEAPPPARAHDARVQEGYKASAQIGSGFVDTYGLGLGARVGYTLSNGIYVGGDATYYFGNTVASSTGDISAHAIFVGGEGGYEFFPEQRWEVCPYVFLGPSFIHTVQAAPFASESTTRFAVAPGLLTAYHFGGAFVSAEAKVHVTPNPTAFTVFGGTGLGF
jgi:hypothetical protein